MILFLPQASANVDQTSLLKCLDPRMSQVGVHTKKFLLAPLAALFCSIPHSQNGGTAGDCNGLLSRLCSVLLVTIAPKSLAATQSANLATCLDESHKLIFQFRGGIVISRPQQCNRLLRHCLSGTLLA